MNVLIVRICLVFFSIFIHFTTETLGGESLPDVKLRVATRFSENSAWGKEINVLTLSCFEGNCELVTLVLNKCYSLADEKEAQSPFAYTVDTGGGGLHIQRSGNTLLVEEPGGLSGVTRKMMFEFIPGRLMATKLKSFSGAYIKNSDILVKIIVAELLPLQGDYQTVELDCPIELPGIPKNN